MEYTEEKLIYGQIHRWKSCVEKFLSWQIPTHGGNPTPQPPVPSLGLLRSSGAVLQVGHHNESVFAGFVCIFCL